ncbi:hypothetical protein [Haloferula sp. BvORR071]|uniref:hypothetical protein n=1 Tax=Haloferula sp. BvORR071 TaxID=1396141 RepID=UPI00054F3F00|nr:hypothetical protein [Haloferula sp. BvORR071]
MQRKGLLATSYLAAIAAGVIVRQPWRETPSAPPAAPPVPAAVEEIQRQLRAKAAEDLASQQDQARREKDYAKAPTKTREEEIRDTLRSRQESLLEDKNTLAQLLARSPAFQSSADLGPALTDALRADDGMAEAAAIFLEWHRRDPQAAFAEYARRPLMDRIFGEQDCLFLQFTPEEIAAQVSLLRPDDFKGRLLRGMAWRFSESNDLEGLSRLMEQLTAPQQQELAETFARSNWVPEDGAAAVAFMANEMPLEVRKTVLRELAGCESYYLTSTWVSSVASSLILQTLGQEELATIAERATNVPTGSGCGGGGDEGLEITPLEPGLGAEEAGYAVSSRVHAAFYYSKDYRESFAAGTMSGDEVVTEIRRLIPGSDIYGQDLFRRVYVELASYQPAVAQGWASAHLGAAELAELNLEVLETYAEPRTSRLAELLHALSLSGADPEHIESKTEAIATRFAAWRALDPEAAGRALEAIPINHPLRLAAAGETAKEESQ